MIQRIQLHFFPLEVVISKEDIAKPHNKTNLISLTRNFQTAFLRNLTLSPATNKYQDLFSSHFRLVCSLLFIIEPNLLLFFIYKLLMNYYLLFIIELNLFIFLFSKNVGSTGLKCRSSHR